MPFITSGITADIAARIHRSDTTIIELNSAVHDGAPDVVLHFPGDAPAGADVAEHLTGLAKAVTGVADATFAESLLNKNAADLTTAEWARFGEILDSDRGGEVIDIPRQIEGLPSLPKIAKYKVKPPEIADDSRDGWLSAYYGSKEIEAARNDAQAYFDAWAVRRMSSSERASEFNRLVGTDESEFTRSDWGRLSALLDSDPEHKEFPIQDLYWDRRSSLARIAKAHVQGYDPRQISSAQPFFDTWKAMQLPAADRQAMVADILKGYPTSISDEQLRTLRTLIDSDPDGTIVQIPRKISGEYGLREAIGFNHNNDRSMRYLQSYIDHWNISQAPAHVRKAQADSLMERSADSLDRHEWKRLSMLLETDPHGEIVDVPRELPRAYDLHRLALEGSYGYKTGSQAQRYFDAWAVRHLSDEQQLTRAAQILSKHSTTVTGEERRQLLALVDADTGRDRIGIPRELDNKYSLADYLLERGDGGIHASAQPYFDAWRVRAQLAE
jgi:hypothetical protein